MTPKEMIAVLEAHERGEKVEIFTEDKWLLIDDPEFNFGDFDYRIEPKQMTLVERLRHVCTPLNSEAADRICELERINAKPIYHYTQEELINEVRRRMV